MKSEQIVNVTLTEMVNVLKGIEVGQFVNVVTLTVPTMTKTGNPFYDKTTKTFCVSKLSSTNYRTSNYQDRVDNNYVKEGLNPTFKSEKPTGRTHVPNTDCLLVSDKDPNTFYLMVERFDEVKPNVTYLKDGEPMDEIGLQILKGFLSTPSKSSKQEQDRKVMVITPKVENILSITYNGIKYVRV